VDVERVGDHQLTAPEEVHPRRSLSTPTDVREATSVRTLRSPASAGVDPLSRFSKMSKFRSILLASALTIAPIVALAPVAAEAQEAGAKQEAGAVREIEVVVDRGYTPARIEVSEGERVRLKFIRREYTPCTREVLFPSLNIREELPPNKPVVIELP